jgi:hypothetical protein
MHYHLFNGGSLLFIHLEHPEDQVSPKAGNTLEDGRIQVNSSLNDVFNNTFSRGWIREEWEKAAEHDVKEDTCAPNIGSKGVREALKKDLWRAEEEGANPFKASFLIKEDLREAKVNQNWAMDYLTRRRRERHNHNVLKLDISMDYSLRINVMYSHEDYHYEGLFIEFCSVS